MYSLLQFGDSLFYAGYAWARRSFGPHDAPEITGLAAVYLPSVLNLFTLLTLAGWLLHRALLPTSLPPYVSWPLALAWLAPQYWYFVHDRRYLALAATFDGYGAAQRGRLRSRALLYVAASVIAFGTAAYYARNYPNPLQLAA